MTREQLEEMATDIWRREFGEHSPYTGWVERVATTLRKLDAEAFNRGVEASADCCEENAGEHPIDIADNFIRALKVEVPK